MINKHPKINICLLLLFQTLMFQCGPTNNDNRINDMDDVQYAYQVKQS